MREAVGVDIGGTKIAVGLVDPAGRVRAVLRQPTPRDRRQLIAAVGEAVRSRIALARAETVQLAGVGVGTGGVVDSARGVVLSASDVIADWSGVHLADELRGDAGDLPVRVDNDGNTFALAESRWGAAADADDAIFVAVGTGIGGGVLLDGRLRRGPRLSAGEFGRLRVAPGVDLESVASGPALAREYARRSRRADAELRAVAVAAAAGDAIADSVIRDGGRAVGSAMALLAEGFDIPVVVVGGGVADIGARYLEAVSEGAGSGAPVRIVAASQGSLSSIAGAAALVLE